MALDIVYSTYAPVVKGKNAGCFGLQSVKLNEGIKNY